MYYLKWQLTGSKQKKNIKTFLFRFGAYKSSSTNIWGFAFWQRANYLHFNCKRYKIIAVDFFTQFSPTDDTALGCNFLHRGCRHETCTASRRLKSTCVPHQVNERCLDSDGEEMPTFNAIVVTPPCMQGNEIFFLQPSWCISKLTISSRSKRSTWRLSTFLFLLLEIMFANKLYFMFGHEDKTDVNITATKWNKPRAFYCVSVSKVR